MPIDKETEESIKKTIDKITSVQSHLTMINDFASLTDKDISSSILMDITDNLLIQLDEALNNLHNL